MKLQGANYAIWLLNKDLLCAKYFKNLVLFHAFWNFFQIIVLWYVNIVMMLILEAALRHKELKSLTQSHTAVTGRAGIGAHPAVNALEHERHFKRLLFLICPQTKDRRST